MRRGVPGRKRSPRWESSRQQLLMRQFEVRELPAGASICDHLNSELNRRFTESSESPFRPFITSMSDGNQAYGIVYRHWVADSNSVRRALGEWIMRLAHGDASHTAHRNGSPAPGYLELCARRHSGAGLDGHVLDLFRGHSRLRHACKPVSGDSDLTMRVLLADVPEGAAGALRGACRRQGLKVSDALLAALAEACRRHVPFQGRPHRRNIAVGNIIDLRSYGGREIENFGLYLGFTHLVCRPEELADWPRLLRATSRQNLAHRRAGVTHSSTTWWLTALLWQRWLPDGRLYHFYRKEFPLAGGLSNVRLDALLPTWNGSTPILNYTRIAPTGPVRAGSAHHNDAGEPPEPGPDLPPCGRGRHAGGGVAGNLHAPHHPCGWRIKSRPGSDSVTRW